MRGTEEYRRASDMSGRVGSRLAPSGGIIGREGERSRIHAAIERASSGRGGFLAISGEPGIGKTTLARDALNVMRRRGFQALEGRCDTLNHGLAYAPVVEAVGRGLRALPRDLRSEVVSRLTPLAALLPGLDLPADEPTGDPALDRTRLFEALLRLLDRLSRRSPLVLAIDDLQWADRSTLTLLSYISRDLAGMPLLIVTTHVSASDGRDAGELADLLVTLRRSELLEEVVLGPMPDEHIRELMTSVLGNPPTDSLARFVLDRGQGNPLFASTLLDSLAQASMLTRHDDRWVLQGSPGRVTPPIIRDLLAERLALLSPEERSLLDALAVGGETVSGPVLSDVLRGDIDTVIQSLVRRGLATEELGPVTQYATAHPLLRDVAYEALPARDRRALHAAFANVFARQQPVDVERAAVHAQRARPLLAAERVLDLSLSAAHAAFERSAGPEAVVHLEQAQALAQAERPDQLPAILTLLGEARAQSGDPIGASEAWHGAIAAAGPEADRYETARIHLRAATVLSETDFASSDREVAAGLARLGDDAPTELTLELLLVAATVAHRQGDLPGVVANVDRIVALRDRVATDRAFTLASAARLISLLEQRRYRDVEDELGRQSLRGGPIVEGRAINAAALVAAVNGDLPRLHAANHQIIELARRYGLPSWGFRTHQNLFIDAFYAGDWDRADEALTEGRDLGERLGHPLIPVVAQLLSAMLAACRGDFGAATAACSLDTLLAFGGPPQPIRHLATAMRGIVDLERGDAAAAASLLESGPLLMGSSMPPWDLVALGEARARLGRTRAAAEVSEELAAMGQPGSWPAAMAARIDGLCAVRDRRSDDAIAKLEAAAALFQALSMPFEEARAGLELTRLLVALGGADSSLSGRLESWTATFDRLGAAAWSERARRMLGRLQGTATLPPIRREALTARQREIAELVAAGLSNAEIAERLFLSIRTVTSHLEHIYNRLGIDSRAALAAFIVRAGFRDTG